MTPLMTKTRMTAEEFFVWCNQSENRDRHFELDRGEAVEVSRPGVRHGFVCLNVGRILANYTFERRKGFVCGNDTGIVLERDPDTVRGPDVVLFDQMQRYDDLTPRYSENLPTLAVEVFSPNDTWAKVTRRITRFLDRGIAVIWLIDPEGQSATVYRRTELPQVSEGTDELTGEPELPGFRCRVADFFYMPGEETVPGLPGQG